MRNAKNGVLFGWFCLFLGGMLVFCGCGNSNLDREITLNDLHDPNPTVRILAIKLAGEQKAESAVPALVDLLQDEDRSVRFYAIGALKRITGTDHGYHYQACPEDRVAAVQRWRDSIGGQTKDGN